MKANPESHKILSENPVRKNPHRENVCHTPYGRCGFQPHLRDWINTGSVRKPNLPQCTNDYRFYYNNNGETQ